ncbi:MAG TPA: IMP dehydrogenase, partial [Candidatus Thalassarchaeaceae archaeon]|nr:IMP dehydrogenase [Candidatus Thalassarchaeaceae archaeon]
MDPIKEALTFDDVTLAPNYSEILPSEVDTKTVLSKNLTLKIPLLSSAMDTVTESKMAIAISKSGGMGIIHRNLSIEEQVREVKKVKKNNYLVGAAIGVSPKDLERAKELSKVNTDLIVIDTAHGHTQKVLEMIKKIKESVGSRKDKNFLIIVRTDANTVEGIDKTLDRIKAYEDAGADMIFPEAMKNEKEFEKVRKIS